MSIQVCFHRFKLVQLRAADVLYAVVYYI